MFFGDFILRLFRLLSWCLLIERCTRLTLYFHNSFSSTVSTWASDVLLPTFISSDNRRSMKVVFAVAIAMDHEVSFFGCSFSFFFFGTVIERIPSLQRLAWTWIVGMSSARFSRSKRNWRWLLYLSPKALTRSPRTVKLGRSPTSLCSLLIKSSSELTWSWFGVNPDTSKAIVAASSDSVRWTGWHSTVQ